MSVVPTTQTDIYVISPKGPFSWGSIKFPEFISRRLKEATRDSFAGTHGGFATQDVNFSTRLEHSELSYLVAYDPSVGYLPRYVRLVAYDPSTDGAVTEEMFLLEARRCSHGGYVPSEWIELTYEVPQFHTRYPDFSPKSVIERPSAEVTTGWFRADRIADKGSESAVESSDGFTHLTSWGGILTLHEHPKTLSFTELRTALGLKIYASPPAPHIHPLEAAEFDNLPKSRWKNWLGSTVLILIGCVFLVGGFRRYRNARCLCLILLFVGIAA